MVSDKETARLLRKARLLKKVATSEGWPEAREELLSLVSNLNNMSSLDMEKDVAHQIAVRQEVMKIMRSWVGLIETAKTFKEQKDNQPWIVRNTDLIQ